MPRTLMEPLRLWPFDGRNGTLFEDSTALIGIGGAPSALEVARNPEKK